MEVGQREFSVRGGRIILHTRADDKHGVLLHRQILAELDERGRFKRPSAAETQLGR